MRRVLLTGATGFIGYGVAQELCRRGVPVRLMARRPMRGPLLSHLDAEFVQADLESPQSLERAVDGVDTVIHLAGRATFEAYAVVAPSIVHGATTLAKAAVRQGVRSFVFSSSLLVYADSAAPVDASTPSDPQLDYARAKVEAEGRLMAVAEQGGMSLACLRLPHVYGARDLLFDNVRRGRNISPGNGRNLVARLHIDDCVQLLVECARQSWHGVTPVSDNFSATWNQFFDVVRLYYPRFREWKVPAPLAKTGTFCLAQAARLARRPTILTPDAVTGWNLNVPVAPGLLWDELGLTPRYPTIHEGIPTVLDDCLAFRWLHPLKDHCI